MRNDHSSSSISSTRSPNPKALFDLFKQLFCLNDELTSLLIDSISLWDSSEIGTQEVIFFAHHIIAESHGNDNGYNAKNAMVNADTLSIKQCLYILAKSGCSLDPIYPTAYTQVRYDKNLNKMVMSLDLNYKGKIAYYKRNGYIKDCLANLVFTNDEFEWKGNDAQPNHNYDPFLSLKQRGSLVGGYGLTERPDGSVEAEFIDAKLLWESLALSKSPSLIEKWQEKMLLKTVFNQISKTWAYYQAESVEPIKHTKFYSSDDFELTTNQSDLTVNALKAAIKLVPVTDFDVGSLLLNFLCTLDNDFQLNSLPAFSKLTAFLALAKYGLSIDRFSHEAFLSPLRFGQVKLLNVSVMYKGFRKIAFSGVMKTTLATPDKIEFRLVHENDVFEYNGHKDKPKFSTDVTKSRGKMIGGYVVIYRGDDHRCCCVSRETLINVASCARAKGIQNKWPRQYFEVKLLRQTFSHWI